MVLSGHRQVDRPQKPLSWWQRQYYQIRWKQRLHFTTTPGPGGRTDSQDTRMVYPCYCYHPPLDGESTTSQYERYMVEGKEIFILNK
ncbi:uncharacterized protein [Drosophila tropicalis]|uniref:uncharacterized protein n=1 Tax=Drosophila tropicalis TaxID=46794 RepID=UPI0035ABC55F